MSGPNLADPEGFARLVEELREATVALEQRKKELGHARRMETDATNRVNQAQKDLDKALAELHSKAPRESDWARQKERRIAEMRS